MKSYIYQRTEKMRGGHTHYTVTIWRIVRGKPIKVAQATDTFCSSFQQFRDVMRAKGLWPKAADATYPNGVAIIGYAGDCEKAGVMRVTEI